VGSGTVLLVLEAMARGENRRVLDVHSVCWTRLRVLQDTNRREVVESNPCLESIRRDTWGEFLIEVSERGERKGKALTLATA